MAMIDNVFLGTTIKLALSATGTPSVKMSDCNFDVFVWSASSNDAYSNKPDSAFHLTKAECITEDDNTYIAAVPTDEIGKGYVITRLVIFIEDTDCANGLRKEVLQALPNIKIV